MQRSVQSSSPPAPPAPPASFDWRWFAIPLLIGSITFVTTNPAIAQENLPRTISVTGKGTERIPTTLAQVNLGVEVQGKTAEAVQQEVARRSSAVVALLQSRRVEQLQTTGIQLNPIYSYNDNVQKLTGYAATNTVSFRLSTEQVGNLLDAAVKAGATRIEGISFTATDSAIAAAQQQALRLATQAAQQQANAVLSELNLTPKAVVNIQVNDAVPPQPPVPLNRTAMAEKDEPTPVIGGEQRVEASVTLQISY